MIGYIQGKVLDADGKKAIVLTNSGIGYEINFGYFLDIDSTTACFIHHHISENDESLWGFQKLEDKKMFELLKTVNKVGSSKAYPLITNVGTSRIIQAISFDQVSVLTEAPGIGKKMAEQIILSLKDKIDKFQTTYLKTSEVEDNIEVYSPNDKQTSTIDHEVLNDVVLALDSLGYKDKDVIGLVKNQLMKGFTSSEDIIKNVLKEL